MLGRSGGTGSRSRFDVELCVVSITMEGYPMSADDMTTEHINDEKYGAKY